VSMALELGHPQFVRAGGWNPSALVDACSSAVRAGTARELLMLVQAREYALFAAYLAKA
jgi:hypothetical protein